MKIREHLREHEANVVWV